MKVILGRQDFCFYYMFKTNFSGHNKIGGNCPWIPRGYGLVSYYQVNIRLETNVFGSSANPDELCVKYNLD